MLFLLDSGIQSVGDSIRGSSDSMTNGSSSHGTSNNGSTSLAASATSTSSASDNRSNTNEIDSVEKKANKIPTLVEASAQKSSTSSEGNVLFFLSQYPEQRFNKKSTSIDGTFGG